MWDHDIKIARNYNETSQNDDDLTASQQIVKENLANIENKDDPTNRLYRQSYKTNWSGGMNAMYGNDATISDLEGISLCMDYPTRSTQMKRQFDTKPIKIQNNQRNALSSPSASPSASSSSSYPSKMSQPRSPSLFSHLQSMNKFRLEKIPEVPPPPLSTTASAASTLSSNENTNPTDSPNNSENSQNYLVTSNDVK